MSTRRIVQGVMCLLVLVWPALAADGIVPSWMKYDAARRTVELRVVAAYNGNNGSWNYNGYYEGGLTAVIPTGWKVKIAFENPDGNYPHSLLVTDTFAEDAVPAEAGREYVAIPRAYSRSPKAGCLSCKDMLRFKAKKAGRYYLFCGVAGHGQAGMWDHFVVSDEAETPYATIADDAFAPEDQPPYE